MKKIKNKKNIFSVATVMFLSIIGANNAQASVGWPVVNVMDNYYYQTYFGKLGVFTSAMGQQNNTIKGAIDTHRAATETQIKQAMLYQRDTDMRLRKALGEADIAKRDFEQMPTLEQCAELSRGKVYAKVLGASENKGSTPYKPSGDVSTSATAFNDYINRELVTSQQVNRSQRLKNVKYAKTCTPDLADMKLCPEPGNSASPTAKSGGDDPFEFSGADIYPYGILGNSSNKEKLDKKNDFANYSMSDFAYNGVAKKYISDATYGNMPEFLESTEQKLRNPQFVIKYNNMRIKLNAAREALDSIAAYRIAPSGNLAGEGSIAESILKEFKENFSILYPYLKQPEFPSVFELMRFNVHHAYFTKIIPVGDVNKYWEESLQRQATNNMLTLRMMEQQEKTNMLLAHILVQLTTPVNTTALQGEASATRVK